MCRVAHTIAGSNVMASGCKDHKARVDRVRDPPSGTRSQRERARAGSLRSVTRRDHKYRAEFAAGKYHLARVSDGNPCRPSLGSCG